MKFHQNTARNRKFSQTNHFHRTGFWNFYNDSWDCERKGLEHRRMMRVLAPWITENPILMHVRSAQNEAVKKAIDQCAEVGFEMVIMTFGSGFNAEDASAENLVRFTHYAQKFWVNTRK